jgi:tripartite-type tricarboxylate transporter receptor subunit TctC
MRRSQRLRVFLAFGLSAALWAASPHAVAQDASSKWPDRPVRFVVPFPAGSASDIVARIVAQKLSSHFGQQFVIDNRSGASGNIGAETIARSAADGYVIGLATNSTHGVAASLSAKLPYNPVTDFAPVSMIGASPYVLAVNPAVRAHSVAELIVLAKSKPKALSYGSAGTSSLAYLAGELFSYMAGVQLTHVPYRSSAQAVLDVAGGRIDMQFGTLGPTLEQIRDNQLRPLGVTGAKRIEALPDVPTLQQAGLPGYEVELWMAVVMPAGTPSEIVARLNKALREVLTSPDGIAALRTQQMEAEPGTPEALGERIQSEIAKWRKLATSVGLKEEQ